MFNGLPPLTTSRSQSTGSRWSARTHQSRSDGMPLPRPCKGTVSVVSNPTPQVSHAMLQRMVRPAAHRVTTTEQRLCAQKSAQREENSSAERQQSKLVAELGDGDIGGNEKGTNWSLVLSCLSRLKALEKTTEGDIPKLVRTVFLRLEAEFKAATEKSDRTKAEGLYQHALTLATMLRREKKYHYNFKPIISTMEAARARWSAGLMFSELEQQVFDLINICDPPQFALARKAIERHRYLLEQAEAESSLQSELEQTERLGLELQKTQRTIESIEACQKKLLSKTTTQGLMKTLPQIEPLAPDPGAPPCIIQSYRRLLIALSRPLKILEGLVDLAELRAGIPNAESLFDVVNPHTEASDYIDEVAMLFWNICWGDDDTGSENSQLYQP